MQSEVVALPDVFFFSPDEQVYNLTFVCNVQESAVLKHCIPKKGYLEFVDEETRSPPRSKIIYFDVIIDYIMFAHADNEPLNRKK